MPNNITQPTVYLRSGDPATEHRAADSYSGGQLGVRFTVRSNPASPTEVARGYQLVQMDSAVDVAASDGAMAWWRRATGYVVTTDVSVAGRGNAAGILRCAAAVDEICCVQQSGPISTLQAQTSPTAAPTDQGLPIIPSATDGKVDVLAAGTAPSYASLGKSTSTATAGVFSADLNIPGRA
jgi:hypothetical protein